MALRLVQVSYPSGQSERVRSSLPEGAAVASWEQECVDERSCLNLLVDTRKTESILDTLEERLAWTSDYRIVLLPVEATLPRIEEPEPTPEEVAAKATEPPKSLPNRISRVELESSLFEDVRTEPIFLALVVLSAIVAALGLIRDDLALLVGAMVIAPLLKPNVALALATTLGDFKTARRVLVTNIAGVTTAFAFSVAVGLLVPFDPEVPSIANRTVVSYGDILLALAAGSAGALGFTSGVSSSMVGVMVAVALLPPVVVTGALLGAGEVQRAFGALHLFAVNVICVNLTAVLTFALQGVKPRAWWEAERARKATHRAVMVWTALLVALAAIVALSR